MTGDIISFLPSLSDCSSQEGFSQEGINGAGDQWKACWGEAKETYPAATYRGRDSES